MAAIMTPGVAPPLLTCRKPERQMAATVRYIKAFIAGFIKAKTTSTPSCVLISSSLALPKRAFSYNSRTQALMMRRPETSSCIMELSLSSWAWRRRKSGFAFHRQNAKTPTINGNAHSIINPNARLSRNIKVMLPSVKNTQRTMPRTNWETKFCTWVMSFVTRVTSVPAPNWSI